VQLDRQSGRLRRLHHQVDAEGRNVDLVGGAMDEQDRPAHEGD
jgi:hypothetical protein